MNTPALVSRMDQNALPQWNAAAPGYIAMQSGSDAEQSRMNSRFKAAARRYWWVAFLIWAIIGIPATILIYKFVSPQYLSEGEISISPVRQNPLNGNDKPEAFYSEFVHTQAELAKSPAVLSKTAGDPSLKNLAWFKALPDQIGYLSDHVDVFPIGGTQNIAVSFAHTDPVASMLIVNAVLDAYDSAQQAQQATQQTKATAILQNLQDTTERALKDNEAQYAKLTADTDVAWSAQDQKVLLDVISSSKQTLGQLQGQQLSLQAQLEDAKSRKLPDEKLYKESVATDTDPQISQWVQERIRVQMADNVLASKHATLEHPDRVEYRKQLRVLDSKIAARRQEIQNNAWNAYQASYQLDRTKKINDLTADLAALSQQINSLQTHIADQEKVSKDLNAKTQPIVMLKSQIADERDALKRYQDRLQEIQIMNQTPIVSIWRLESPPKTPKVDRHPKLALAANGFGLILGLGVLVLLIKLRDRIEGADDLGNHYQPLVVGTVSHAGGTARGLHGRMSRKILGEEMRLLHANLLPPGRTERRIMMVTSPTPSNGKTSIASQLALSLAKSGLEVLLIDADLRKRDLSTMFDVGFRPGLSDLLQGRAPELIRPVELLPNLRLMGAGSKLERNPVELLQRKHFRESLNLLQDKFDCIVVDTPPTLVVADARLMARSCDEVLCVVRAQVSSQKDVDQTIDALTRITGKTPKIILNGVAHRQSYYKYKFAYSNDDGETEPVASGQVQDVTGDGL